MWLLTGKTVFQYLINTPNPIINIGYEPIQNGSLSIQESFGLSRNCIFRVYFENKNNKYGFFLKQSNNKEQNFITSIRNEANFYRFAKSNLYIGNFLDFDIENNVLIFKTDIDFRPVEIDVYKEEIKWIEFTDSISKMLFDLHNSFSTRQDKAKFLPSFQPNLLTKERRYILLKKMRDFENKNLRDVAIRLESLDEIIAKIEKRWEKDETVIHRDVRYVNFIYNQEKKEFKLIDWEMAALGDRCWDLAEFSFHLLKKIIGRMNVEEDAELSIYLLPKIVESVILKYFEQYKINEDSLKITFVKKVLQFFAIRLIENFATGILNNLWEDDKKDLEFERVSYFIELIEKDDNDSFYVSYLPKLYTL